MIAFSDSDKDKLEIFHRFVAKHISRFVRKTANVMRTAQLGWFSMSSATEIRCLIFMTTLFDTATPDIYRSIAIQSWIKLSNGVTSLDRSSPIQQMYKVCIKYCLANTVSNWLNDGCVPSKARWKNYILNIVYTSEISRWKCLCILFNRTDIFASVITNIGVCFWYNLAHENVNVAKQCRTIMKLITKENCLQANVSRLLYSIMNQIFALCVVRKMRSIFFGNVRI